MPFTLVSVEGNIGSGKSVVMDALKQRFKHNPRVLFLEEPVNEWAQICDEHGTDILTKFYNDKEAYAFEFQMVAFISRVESFKRALALTKLEPTHHFVLITERTIYTDCLVFAQMLRDLNKMTYMQHCIYLKWFKACSEDMPLHKIVYIKTTPTICEQRIHTRLRPGESAIELPYLTQCESYHTHLMDTIHTLLNDTHPEKLVLNGDTDMKSDDVNIIETHVSHIVDFIGQSVAYNN